MALPINTIVLDVGKVLVNFDYGLFFRAIQQRFGVEPPEPLQFLCEHGLLEHEHGRLSGAEFMQRLGSSILPSSERSDAALEQLQRYWVDIFEPIEEMSLVIRTLVPRYRVFLLSNTGELHWGHVEKRFGFLREAHGALTSYRVGIMKPDPAIYQLAEERFGLTPGRTVFVDDKRENVEAALGRGWHGIVHVSPEETRSELARLGALI